MEKTKILKRSIVAVIACAVIIATLLMMSACGNKRPTVDIDTSSSNYQQSTYREVKDDIDFVVDDGNWSMSKYEFLMDVYSVYEEESLTGYLYGHFDTVNDIMEAELDAGESKVDFYIQGGTYYSNEDGKKYSAPAGSELAEYILQQIPTLEFIENNLIYSIDSLQSQAGFTTVAEVAVDGNVTKYHLKTTGTVQDQEMSYELYIIVNEGLIEAVQGEVSRGSDYRLTTKLKLYDGEIELPNLEGYTNLPEGHPFTQA